MLNSKLNAATIPPLFVSNSHVYAAVLDVLGGTRAETDSPVALAEKIKVALAVLATKHENPAIASEGDTLTVAIAGKGITTLADLAAGEVELPAPGDAGYMVGTASVKAAIKSDDGDKNALAMLVVYPSHSLDSYLATDEGKAYMVKLLTKEAGLVAFRPVRVAVGETTLGQLDAGACAMPLAVSDYTSPTRDPAASFAVFNDFWAAFVNAVSASSPETARVMAALPKSKAEVLKSIRSKPYAAAMYPALEGANLFARVAVGLQSLVAAAMASLTTEGKAPTHDPAAIGDWLSKRESLDLRGNVAADLGGIDLSAFTF